MMSPEPVAPAPSRIQIILWEDIFVVVDDGGAPPSAYEVLRQKFVERSSHYKGGLGLLAIVPTRAKSPSPAARKAMTAAFETAPLRCICWVVEGSGFEGAMVRAVITGMRVITRPAYPTHVAGDLEQGLGWILPHLEGGAGRVERVRDAAATIRAKRATNN
jgi:hypothetical protein